jgi:hypothetical protein
VSEPGQHCPHPWLRVTCGVCGEAVDALSETAPEAAGEGTAPRRLGVSRLGGDDSQALFIVARGHPELLDQLRVVMGHEKGVEIIEDRRQRPRAEEVEEAARELRKRLREDGQG